MTEEEWVPVPGFEGYYETSNLGGLNRLRVRITRSDGRVAWSKSGPIKGHPNATGHVVVRLKSPTRSINTQMHRIVCEAFHGPAPEGKPLVLHWDDNPSNNRADNLRWGDLSDNQRDSVRNGTHVNTKKTHCKKGNHPLSGDNLRITSTGRRECVTCGDLLRYNWKQARIPDELSSEEDTRHGTPIGYSVYKCRCDKCVTGHYSREKVNKAKRYAQGLAEDDERHGTLTGYKIWGCRCDDCRKSNANAEAERKRKRAEELLNRN